MASGSLEAFWSAAVFQVLYRLSFGATPLKTSLTGGFWALISVVQTPGAPPLHISHPGNTITVYWQAVPGWNLQQNSSVNSAGGWSASSGITTSNGTNYLNFAAPNGNLFFRLSNP